MGKHLTKLIQSLLKYVSFNVPCTITFDNQVTTSQGDKYGRHLWWWDSNTWPLKLHTSHPILVRIIFACFDRGLDELILPGSSQTLPILNLLSNPRKKVNSLKLSTKFCSQGFCISGPATNSAHYWNINNYLIKLKIILFCLIQEGSFYDLLNLKFFAFSTKRKMQNGNKYPSTFSDLASNFSSYQQLSHSLSLMMTFDYKCQMCRLYNKCLFFEALITHHWHFCEFNV